VVGDSLLGIKKTPIMMKPFTCTCKIGKIYRDWHFNYSRECLTCNCNKRLLKKSLTGWEHSILSKFSKETDQKEVDEILIQLKESNILSFKFMGYEVGKIALHDIILEYKIDNLKLQQDNEIWSAYQNLVRGCMLTILWMHRALTVINPSALVVYNSNYSINNCVGQVAQKMNISWYSIHGGPSLAHVWNTLMLTPGKIEDFRTACVENWEKGYEKCYMNYSKARNVLDHFDELLTAKKVHAYSSSIGSQSAEDFFQRFTKRKSQKKILLALSSTDERLAIQESGIRPIDSEKHSVFESQYELISFLIEKVKDHPDIELIIRVHPRDFPNKRENRISSNALKLKSLLIDTPDNVIINWPEDNVSVYNLFTLVDIVITAWSTVLLEASLFGCPIILPWDQTRYYDAIADSVCLSKAEYWEKILDHIDKEWTIERSIKTFKWYWMVQFGATVSLKPIQKRAITLSENIILFGERLIKKIYPDIKRNPLISDAYWGDYMPVLTRSSKVEGYYVIQETLKGTLNPLNNFQVNKSMNKIINDCDSSEDVSVAKALNEIGANFIEKISADQNRKSKFYKMQINLKKKYNL
jgi:hypothetical protein